MLQYSTMRQSLIPFFLIHKFSDIHEAKFYIGERLDSFKMWFYFPCQVEVQKLLKQNEYLERSISEMETDLREAIQDADTSERDARYCTHTSVWGHLQLMNHFSGVGN